MPYVALEDVGTTQRRRLSGRRRLQAWERTGGICVVCGRAIDGVRERWIVEHIRALELGGTDDLENMGPAHEACGREKTRDDHARTARAKRQKIRHLGATVITRPLPGSRTCALKRKINGMVIAREMSIDGHAHREPGIRRRGSLMRRSRALFVEAGVETLDRLCNQVSGSAKENGTGTEHPMSDRARSMRTREAVGARADAPVTGDILPAISRHLDFLFDDRPLLPGENAEQYDALLRSIVQQVRPADVIEALWVKDVVDLIWQAKGYRRSRIQILVRAQLKAAAELIMPMLGGDFDPISTNEKLVHDAEVLAAGWMNGNKEEKNTVDGLLQDQHLTVEDVKAHGFLMNLQAIERIDRLVLSADQRRDALLREIERKRASLAHQMRDATAAILDADDVDVR